MRFNNNLFLLAPFLGVATALRRGCKLDTSSGAAGTGITGFYTLTGSDTLLEKDPGSNNTGRYYTVFNGDELTPIAEDFCTSVGNVQYMNSDLIKSNPITPG
ncbi:hypothetical protein MBM_08216 [Drepanopeziza brunnea f. sp. 'multigermtubi' MB_m1]|uniref:LysM domain-containing protein n=1 Tax=Marssonina brunnea f. sp. multigermtubi (strain MB_m1) TaxID=1072389 RepID=K1WXY3_MARBU|nr:uncharacterized protein MBM_08216 [Drepanopeziza brunnea f. sp. 'multigermtubi' MB_m1]EKD13498.1 hypothetical protein MBM_08216 [Drepanopeziza brunnea f. sp. 'multigermtubi' MB_m1]